MWIDSWRLYGKDEHGGGWISYGHHPSYEAAVQRARVRDVPAHHVVYPVYAKKGVFK